MILSFVIGYPRYWEHMWKEADMSGGRWED